MTQTNLFQPGDAEASAAIAALTDTNPGRGVLIDGKLCNVWAVNDIVLFRTPDGETRKGIVVEVLVDAGNDSEYHIAAHVPGKGRQHYAVANKDVQIF
jgi:hypothetical protein